LQALANITVSYIQYFTSMCLIPVTKSAPDLSKEKPGALRCLFKFSNILDYAVFAAGAVVDGIADTAVTFFVLVLSSA
jgi:hypothetical protein